MCGREWMTACYDFGKTIPFRPRLCLTDMLSILSPAKTLDFDSPSPVAEATKPALMKDAATLAETLKTLTPQRAGQFDGH